LQKQIAMDTPKSMLDPGDATPRASDSAYESAPRDVRAHIGPLIDRSHHGYTP
jgi:hypothetical protein